MNKKILVVAAHPDDEILGCGATIARHCKEGDSVDILILGEGAASRKLGNSDSEVQEEISKLRIAGAKAAALLGANEPTFVGLPDNRLDSIDLLEIVAKVQDICESVGPEVIYTHHWADLNVDHRIVCSAVMTAARPLPGSEVTSIYSFEVLSSSGWQFALGESFDPNYFVDVSETLEDKQNALECYSSEMRDFPHARSHIAIEALAKYRGALTGVEAAEAFVMIRQLVSK